MQVFFSVLLKIAIIISSLLPKLLRGVLPIFNSKENCHSRVSFEISVDSKSIHTLLAGNETFIVIRGREGGKALS